jgi:hypothetical protein
MATETMVAVCVSSRLGLAGVGPAIDELLEERWTLHSSPRRWIRGGQDADEQLTAPHACCVATPSPENQQADYQASRQAARRRRALRNDTRRTDENHVAFQRYWRSYPVTRQLRGEVDAPRRGGVAAGPRPRSPRALRPDKDRALERNPDARSIGAWTGSPWHPRISAAGGLGSAYKKFSRRNVEQAPILILKSCLLEVYTVKTLTDTSRAQPDLFNRHGTQRGDRSFFTQPSALDSLLLLVGWIREFTWIAETRPRVLADDDAKDEDE